MWLIYLEIVFIRLLVPWRTTFLQHKFQEQPAFLDFGSVEDISKDYNTNLKLEELNRALEMATRTLSPGHDGVPHEMILNLMESAIEWLLKLYNRL